jgi:hypothetical protein
MSRVRGQTPDMAGRAEPAFEIALFATDVAGRLVDPAGPVLAGGVRPLTWQEGTP